MAPYEAVEIQKFASNSFCFGRRLPKIRRQFEFPAAQYFIISKQTVRSVKNFRDFSSLLFSKAEYNDKFSVRVMQNG